MGGDCLIDGEEDLIHCGHLGNGTGDTKDKFLLLLVSWGPKQWGFGGLFLGSRVFVFREGSGRARGPEVAVATAEA